VVAWTLIVAGPDSGGQVTLTFTSGSRNSKGYLKLLKKIERALPQGLIYLIADNLKIHDSALVREWLEGHPRVEHAFIPKGAAWLSLIEVFGGVFSADKPLPDSAALRIATRSTKRQGWPPGN
jgi:DDE superfamily endonuclease